MAESDLDWQFAPEFRRYTGFELVGEGVSAKVYRAHDTRTDSVVAIKAIHPHLASDPISLERFRREVRITREIGHPGVVAIDDLVDLGGRPFMVMEYLAGGDLKQYLRLNSPLAIATVVDIMRQILSTLEVCHRHDVVHRDLKPQNVLLDRGGRGVKLVDFGIARMTSLTDLTQTGTSLGTPEYMAPELYAASTYDPRTDLYAVGVIAYEMVAGELPFQADSVAVLFRKHLDEPPPSLTERRPDTPAWLQSLILKLLDKNPYARYQTATEALTDLAAERVLSDSLPDVELRSCIGCSERTTAELPFCTVCGEPRADRAPRGKFDVHLGRDEDSAKLSRFVAEIVPGIDLDARRTTLLVSGVDRSTAEQLRVSARRQGLYVDVRERSQFAGLSWILVRGLLTGLVGWVAWLALFTAAGGWFTEFYPGWAAGAAVGLPRVALDTYATILLLTGALCARLYAREPPPPLIGPGPGRRGALDVAAIGLGLAIYNVSLLAITNWLPPAPDVMIGRATIATITTGASIGCLYVHYLRWPLRRLSARYRFAVQTRRSGGVVVAGAWCVASAALLWSRAPALIAVADQPFLSFGLAALAGGPLLVGWWLHDWALRLAAFQQPAIAVASASSWLAGLAEQLRAMSSRNMRRFSSRLIRHCHLLQGSAHAIGAEVSGKLRQLTHQAVEVAHLLSDVEGALERADLGALSRRQRLLGARAEASVDATERVKLEAEAAATLDRLRQYDELQRKHESMTNRLLMIQSSFNGLLAKALVLEVALGADETRELTSNIDLLRGELAVANEVRASLRGLAT